MNRSSGLLCLFFVLGLVFAGSVTAGGDERPPLVEIQETCSKWQNALHNRERTRGIPIACQISDGSDPIPLVQGLVWLVHGDEYEANPYRTGSTRLGQKARADSQRRTFFVSSLWIHRLLVILP